MATKEDTEVIFYQGEPAERDNGYFVASDSDDTSKARHHDNDKTWTVESYDPRVTRRMVELGASEKPSRTDGHLFVVDAKQLIEFVAVSSGLVVEFRKHKKRQLSDETKAKLKERLAQMRTKIVA